MSKIPLAQLFKIARQEGVLTKYADGKADAKEALSLILERIKKVENPYEKQHGALSWFTFEEARQAIQKVMEAE